MRFITCKIMLTLSVATLFACTPAKIIISGQIKTNTGLPISKAKVQTSPRTDLVTTDTDGYFYLTRVLGGANPTSIRPGVYLVSIKKDGFKDIKFRVRAEKGNVWTKSRIMEAEEAPVPVVAPVTTDEEVPTVSIPIIGN